MTDLSLRAYDEGSWEPRNFPLPEGPSGARPLRLRGLPGASAVQLELVSEDQVCRRFEVEAEGDEVIVVHWRRTEDGKIDLWSQGREVLSLPPDERYAPAPPVVGETSRGKALDLAILVDGTMRVYRDGSTAQRDADWEAALGYLLDDEETWCRHVGLLAGVVEGLAEQVDLKLGVFAFGDRPTSSLQTPGLLPRYELYPQSGSGWKLSALSTEALHVALQEIPATSGADFVDALADGLATCVGLPWREDCRRVVLVTGDSPGYSIVHAAPTGANLLARRFDVDTQAMALHRAGVEVATIYHAVSHKRRQEDLDYERALREHTAAQYRRLASRRDLAFEVPGVDASDVARELIHPSDAVARGATYAVLVGMKGDEG